jgi:hypothetical protein
MAGGGAVGEMTQGLYAHMNNKTIKKLFNATLIKLICKITLKQLNTNFVDRKKASH